MEAPDPEELQAKGRRYERRLEVALAQAGEPTALSQDAHDAAAAMLKKLTKALDALAVKDDGDGEADGEAAVVEAANEAAKAPAAVAMPAGGSGKAKLGKFVASAGNLFGGFGGGGSSTIGGSAAAANPFGASPFGVAAEPRREGSASSSTSSKKDEPIVEEAKSMVEKLNKLISDTAKK